ncbi:protein NRT1/ PTR FAMILY 7.3, partial [Sorghum bicolor]
TAAATTDGSVGWNGKPCRRDRSGGWFAGFLMLANQALVTFAVNCVGINLVTFMSVVMRLDNANAANKASNWNGTTYVFSIIGAIVSDSYWGRYKACTIFQLIFVAGLVELAVACHVFLDKSCHFGDGGGRQEHCKPPTTVQAAVFYISIYQIALGNGAYQPAVTTFGADQFDETDARERKSKSAFFGYFFVANNLGGILAVTALAYMEDKGEWVQAFWIATAAALLGYLLFAVGTLRYRHFLATGNALVSVCQVVVAAVRNRRVRAPVREQDLYDPDAADGGHVETGVRKMVHTPEYRCLDKAAVIKDPASGLQLQVRPADHEPNPWRLCTIKQVEELKCILRLVPIWLCSILFSTSYSQMTSVFIEQAQAMDDSLWKLTIPPAGMDVFEILGVTAFVFIYRFCIVKVMTKVSHEPTELQRMGTGLVISTAAMITSGVVEQQRLMRATGGVGVGVDASSTLSILWQIPQYLLIGASEVFMYVTMTEFFNDQLPEGLRSLGSAMSVASMSAGSFASSLLVTLVMTITCRGGRPGWIPQDLNKGHVDWFFYLIAALNAVDLLAFVVFAKRYRPAPVVIHGADENGNGVEKGQDGEECI